MERLNLCGFKLVLWIILFIVHCTPQEKIYFGILFGYNAAGVWYDRLCYGNSFVKFEKYNRNHTHICVGYDGRTYVAYSTVHSCPIKQNSDEAMLC